MRIKTRFVTSIGIATAIAVPALLGTLAGCGLADGGISVVGANPGDGGGAGDGRGVGASASGSGAQDGSSALHGSGALSTASVRATDTAGGVSGAGGAGGVGTPAGGPGGQGAAGGGGGNGGTSETSGAGADAGGTGSSGQTQGAGTGAGGSGHGNVTCTVADLRLRVALAGNASNGSSKASESESESGAGSEAGAGSRFGAGAGPRAGAGSSSSSSNKNVRRQQVTLVYTNISTSACVLRGYANVDFLRSGVGGPLSEPDSFATSVPVTRVELAPGGVATASATFMTNSPHNTHGSHCDDAVAVRTFPPGSTVAIASGVRDARGVTLRHFYVCGHGVVVSALRP